MSRTEGAKDKTPRKRKEWSGGKKDDWRKGHKDIRIEKSSDGKYHVMSSIGALHMFGKDSRKQAQEWYRSGGKNV